MTRSNLQPNWLYDQLPCRDSQWCSSSGDAPPVAMFFKIVSFRLYFWKYKYDFQSFEQESIGKEMWSVIWWVPGWVPGKAGQCGPGQYCCLLAATHCCHMMPRKPRPCSVIPPLTPQAECALRSLILSVQHFSQEIYYVMCCRTKGLTLLLRVGRISGEQVFFQGHSCIEMEGQEFLTEYRSISNKLKKRFLRFVPNSWPSNQDALFILVGDQMCRKRAIIFARWENLSVDQTISIFYISLGAS